MPAAVFRRGLITVSDDVNVRLICPTCQSAIFKSFEGIFLRSRRRFLRGCRYAPDLPDVSNSFQNSRNAVDEAAADKRARRLRFRAGTFSAGLTLDQQTSNLCRICCRILLEHRSA